MTGSVDVLFRLGAAGSDASVECRLRSSDDRWVAVVTTRDDERIGLGRSAGDALNAALMLIRPQRAKGLMADLALLAPSIEIARMERAVSA